MSEANSPPSRRLRGVTLAISVIWWGLVTVWLALALSWGVLHALIVPRIEKARPWLQQQASRMLGMELQIGNLQAHADSWRHLPTLEISDLQLRNAQGEQALHLAHVRATVSPRSLWRLGFEQLIVEQPTLEAKRRTDGSLEVAGFVLATDTDEDNALADWVFSQPELVVQGGRVLWRDEQTMQAGTGSPLTLEHVHLVLRNQGLQHALRLDADAPPHWGGQVHLAAKMQQPLLTLHPGRWSSWQGQVYAQLEQLDLAQLQPYVRNWPAAMQLKAGRGQLRSWLQLDAGQLKEASLDVSLRDLVAQRGAVANAAQSALPSTPATPGELALTQISGRLVWQALPRGYAVRSEGLRFQTRDGLHWSSGDARVQYQAAGHLAPLQGQFSGEGLDLHTLLEVAQRLPLDEKLQQTLRDYAPAGMVRTLRLRWSGKSRVSLAPEAPSRSASLPSVVETAQPSWWTDFDWQAKGRIEGLRLAAGLPVHEADTGTNTHSAENHVPGSDTPGRPGLSGAEIDFDVNQDGGHAHLALDHGQLVFPGVFEEPELPMDSLQAQLRWRRQGQQHSVELAQLDFANADAAGHAKGRWQTGETAASDPGGAGALLPGHLVLEGELTRANGTRVHRYLPLAIPELTRHYVRDAVQAGRATHTVFKVDSGLDQFPPLTPKEGEFRIAADLEGVDFDYVPGLQHDGGPHWPALKGMKAQLIFERDQMQVRQAQGHFQGLPELRIDEAIANLPALTAGKPLLQVQGKVAGAVAQALSYVQRSPLDSLAEHLFVDSQGSGQSKLDLALQIPLDDVNQTRVQGRVELRDATLQLAPKLPALENIQARADFTEHGFQLHSARSRFLGGTLQFSGYGQQLQNPASTARRPTDAGEGSSAARAPFKLQFEGQGVLSAIGLRQQDQQPELMQVGQQLQGQARYRARIALNDGLLEARVESDLLGLGSDLPPPFAKPAETALPLRLESRLSGPRQDHLRLQLGQQFKAEFERELVDGKVRVNRGAIRIDDQGAADANLPASGVDLDVRLQRLDIDAWQKILATPAKPTAQTTSLPAGNAAAKAVSASVVGASSPLEDYMPSRLALQTDVLQFQDRRLHDLRVQGSRQQQTWSIDLRAEEAEGQLAYSLGSAQAPGRLYARLKRVTLGADSEPGQEETGSQHAQVALDDLLDRQPQTLPAMDIEVQQLQIGQRKLGSLQVVAVNRGLRQPASATAAQPMHEWELQTLALRAPEASLTASGHWRWLNDAASPAHTATATASEEAAKPSRLRETELDFKLQARDAGQLLERLGYGQLFRRGEGSLSGKVRWTGSPLSMDYPSLHGHVHIDMRNGQFLKADLGLARLLGVLSLQALPRRLTLDFRDAFSEGFAFDYTRGDAQIEHGVARTNNLQMKGVSAAVLMEGQADLVHETQDLKVVVVPELNTNTMALIATAINPAVGLGTFLAQWVLQRPLLESVTHSFRIRGSWSNPEVQAIKSTPQDTEAGRRVSESEATAAPASTAAPDETAR